MFIHTTSEHSSHKKCRKAQKVPYVTSVCPRHPQVSSPRAPSLLHPSTLLQGKQLHAAWLEASFVSASGSPPPALLVCAIWRRVAGLSCQRTRVCRGVGKAWQHRQQGQLWHSKGTGTWEHFLPQPSCEGANRSSSPHNRTWQDRACLTSPSPNLWRLQDRGCLP